MKKILFLPIVLISCFLILFSNSCKKDTHKLNITLYNKDVPTIKSYIDGKWKLLYTIGGLSGNIKYDYINSSIEFKFQSVDSIIEIRNGSINVKSSINWFRDRDIFSGDTINLLGFTLYSSQLPFDYRVKRIYNDTLILDEEAYDSY